MKFYIFSLYKMVSHSLLKHPLLLYTYSLSQNALKIKVEFRKISELRWDSTDISKMSTFLSLAFQIRVKDDFDMLKSSKFFFYRCRRWTNENLLLCLHPPQHDNEPQVVRPKPHTKIVPARRLETLLRHKRRETSLHQL